MAYTVVRGDTLGAIAKANGTTVDALLTLNPDITNANLINIGQNIKLPGDTGEAQGSEQSSTNDGGSYNVVKGDSLGAIAKANGLTLAELLELNPQYKANPNLINIGDSINLGAGDPQTADDPNVVVGGDDAGGAPIGGADDIIAPEGDEGTAGIMAGGIIHRVDNPEGQEDFYVVAYEYPPNSGHSFFYRFESLDTLQASVGAEAYGNIPLGGVIPEAQLSSWTDGGDSNEILGVQGSFTGFIQDIIRDVSTKAGIGDPTRLGAALANPEIQLIMAKAAEGGWTDAQIKAEMRNADYYKDVLYPGIDNFYGRTDNPEGAYALYKQNVEQNLKTLGVPRDADGSYDTTLVKMLDGGVDDTEFAKMTPVYQRAVANDNYRTSLNQWLVEAGQPELTTFDSFYDVLAGTAPADQQAIVELASLSYVAGEQGLGLEDNLIKEIADRTDLSEAQIVQSFSQSDRDLLSLGPDGLRAAGISQGDIIRARAGFVNGELSLGDMEVAIGKAKTERGISDDPTAKLFTDFTSEGAPIKKGLQTSIAEGA